jgi:hypothetical protein
LDSAALQLADWIKMAMITFMVLYMVADKMDEFPMELKIAIKYFPNVVFVQMLVMWPPVLFGIIFYFTANFLLGDDD